MYAAAELLRAECLRRVRALDRRRPHEQEGFLSTASWLRARARLAHSTAREHVRVARVLETMPVAAQAFRGSDITYSHVRVLASAAEAAPEVYAAHETTLVDAASSLGIRDFRKAVDYWRQNVDADGFADAAEALHNQRRLHVSSTHEGMVRLDGWLDPEGGSVVMTALRSMTEPAARAAGSEGTAGHSDGRTPAQRRADALVEVCRQSMDSGLAESSAGERPHLTVTVSLDALERRAGTPCELDDGAVITPEAALRLACDAGVTRIITRGASEPLDVGRRTRTVPSAIRRAVVLRDGGCRFPECDRPQRWCDAHHIEHWIDGGATSVDNLVLVCRPHHRFVHDRGWRITHDARGSPTFEPP
ncbi:MAG: DUF222 domain-containing protein [Acidimicrobiia bacterium]